MTHRVDLFTPDPEAQATNLQYKRDERAAMMTEAIATGMRHATISPVDRQSELAYIDNAKACEKAVLSVPFERPLLGMIISHYTRGPGVDVRKHVTTKLESSDVRKYI